MAGRKTMKDNEKNDVQSSPSSLKKPPISPDKKVQDVKDTANKEETVRTKEELELDAELNSILKKGPSKLLLFATSANGVILHVADDASPCSHYIQQILLSSFG